MRDMKDKGQEGLGTRRMRDIMDAGHDELRTFMMCGL